MSVLDSWVLDTPRRKVARGEDRRFSEGLGGSRGVLKLPIIRTTLPPGPDPDTHRPEESLPEVLYVLSTSQITTHSLLSYGLLPPPAILVLLPAVIAVHLAVRPYRTATHNPQ